MSDKQVQIPDGMLETSVDAWKDGRNSDIPSTLVSRILTAALRWLADNPIIPTADETKEYFFDALGAKLNSWSLPIILARWQALMFLTSHSPKSNCMVEAPMVFTVPEAGRYSIGVDYGNGEDESVAVVIRVGENGKPDEQVATLHRDKTTGTWVQEAYPDPLVMYIMRHFEHISTDTQLIRNCAEAAAHDYQEYLKRNPAKDAPSGPVVEDYFQFEKKIAESREQDATAACPDLLLIDNSAAHKLHNECVARAYNRGRDAGYAERSSETFG